MIDDNNTTDIVAIDRIRHFNRFYTRELGVLDEGLLSSSFSLTEARILYEIANREYVVATELGKELAIDAGYLSRTLRSLETRKLIIKRTSEKDARQSVISLTDVGRQEFLQLDRLSRDQIENTLVHLSMPDKKNLLAAMTTIERLLGQEGRPEKFSYILRPPEAGDMGWVVRSNGILYAREYDWDARYEALVARIVAEFIDNFDEKNERCWIAEKDGENVGSVFLVKQTEEIAKLRLLAVEPSARGLGIGKRLVDECTRFAENRGYKKITLWTNSVLLAARKIYKEAGYKLVATEPHHSFGHDLVGETWELELRED